MINRDTIINLAREVADPNTTDPMFNDLINPRKKARNNYA